MPAAHARRVVLRRSRVGDIFAAQSNAPSCEDRNDKELHLQGTQAELWIHIDYRREMAYPGCRTNTSGQASC